MTRWLPMRLPQLRHGLIEERRDPPGSRAAADFVKEVPQQPAAVGRMAHLGMELQAEDRQAAMPDRGDRAGRRLGQRHKQPGRVLDLIAMTHPHDGFFRARSANSPALCSDLALGPAKLPAAARRHLAAEQMAHQLHAVTDAEDGNAELKDGRVDGRGVFFVDAGRAAGEDDAGGLQFAHALGRDVVPDDLAEDVLLAHPAGDQLTVLRAEIEDENTFLLGDHVCHVSIL